jgi:hypothetical protein
LDWAAAGAAEIEASVIAPSVDTTSRREKTMTSLRVCRRRLPVLGHKRNSAC